MENNRIRSEVVYGLLTKKDKMFTEMSIHTPCECKNVATDIKFCPHCGAKRISKEPVPIPGYNDVNGVFRKIGVYGRSAHWDSVVVGVQLSCIDSKEAIKELKDPNIAQIHQIVLDNLAESVLNEKGIHLGIYHVVHSYYCDENTLIPLKDMPIEEVFDEGISDQSDSRADGTDAIREQG